MIYAQHLAQGIPPPEDLLLIVSRLPILIYSAFLTFANGAPGSISVAQVVAFNSCIFMLAGAFEVEPQRGFLNIVGASAISALPVTMAFSMASMDSVLLTIGIIGACFSVVGKTKVSVFLLGVSACLIVGARANGMAAFAVLLICVPFIAQNRKLPKICACCCAAAFGILVPALVIPAEPLSPVALSMAWELVALAAADPTKYGTILNFAGSTASAVQSYNPVALNSVFWDANPALPALSIAGFHSGEVVRTYLTVAAQDPAAFFLMKMDSWQAILGTSESYMHPTHGMHLPRVGEFGEAIFADASRSQVPGIDYLTRHPFVTILLGLALVALKAVLRQADARLLALLLSLAYFGSYFAFAQALEFRYFAPTFYCVWAVAFAEIAALVSLVLRKRRPRLTSLPT